MWVSRPLIIKEPITVIPTASSEIRPNFARNRLLQILLAAYAGVWIWAAINPVYPFDWFLENILTVLAVIVLTASYRRFPLSDVSYILIFVFMVLHAVGGHYTYAEVPLGFWLEDLFGLDRNHYDRIVHFSFGLLLAYPFREVVLRLVIRDGLFASLFALTLVFTYSGSFEIMEWIVARIVDPEAGAAYLGTQGDEFDSQKDMGLAASGALIALVLTAVFSVKAKVKDPQGG
jgi:putative membrane protein